MSERKHICVVGGGIIGSSTAYFLSKHPSNPKVTLLEGTSIAAGASGKAGGLLALDWHGASTSSLAELSYRLHSELAAEHDGATKWGYRGLDTFGIEADLTKFNSFFGGDPPKPTVHAHASALDWVDPTIIRGSRQLGTTKSTSQVHPYLFTTSLVELAQASGVEVVIGSLEGIVKDDESGRFLLSASSSGGEGEENKIEIGGVTEVVFAAGPWTGSLAKKLGLKAGRAKEITGSRAHSLVIRPSKPLPAQAIFTAVKESNGIESEPEIYNRPDNTAYICGPTDKSDLPPTASLVTTSPSALAELRKQAAALSPSHLDADAGAEILVQQACYLPVGSVGGDPVIGELKDHRGIYVASGHTCWGITNGPGTGKCLAELILDGKVTSANISKLGP